MFETHKPRKGTPASMPAARGLLVRPGKSLGVRPSSRSIPLSYLVGLCCQISNNVTVTQVYKRFRCPSE